MIKDGKIFNEYSEYYNLLYQDKDYKLEADFISKLIEEYSSGSSSILELGCGTGKHASLLIQKGYEVLGVDLSETMLIEAQKLGLHCELGDVRTFKVDRIFDTVISLFHVASYQSSNQDLVQYFQTAYKHLRPGGAFIFDAWYGPAVLEQKPEKRIKTLENDNLKITRVATPDLCVNNNIVDVSYDIIVENKLNGIDENIKEVHKMRYLFVPEVKFLLNQAGFEMVYSKEWMSEKELSSQSWNACFIGVKK